MRIYWLNPPLSTRNIAPDLGWMNFSTVCKEHDWIQPIADWDLYRNLEELVQAILDESPDVLCISTYVWNVKLCHLVAKEIKQINPEITVIQGGPHQGYNQTFFLEHPYIDYLCYATGHGEYFLKPALNQIEQYGKIVDPDEIPFLISKNYYTNVTQMKFGYDTESAIEHHIPYLLEIKRIANEKNTKAEFYYETTRGCPYSCVYCEWGGGIGTKISSKPFDIIQKELEILSMLQYDSIEFIDANFGILPRDQEVLKIIKRHKDKYQYPTNIYLYGLAKVKTEKKEKILDILFETGFMGDSYNMALQSVSEEALKNIQRTDILLQDNIRLARKFKAKGVEHIKTELIIGIPGSTLDTFYEEMNLFQEFDSWFIPRNILTILPNSEMGTPEYQEKFSIKTVEVGSTENEESDMVHVSNSVISKYRSNLDIVIETYSYTAEDWKEMFFMNRAQRVLGPLVPENEKASVILREWYQKIQTKEWFQPIDNWLNKLIQGRLVDQDIILVDGKRAIEDIVSDNVQDI